MNDDDVELFCTKDTDTEKWSVWFPYPLGGKQVLETFDNEADARAFWQDQIDTADYDTE